MGDDFVADYSYLWELTFKVKAMVRYFGQFALVCACFAAAGLTARADNAITGQVSSTESGAHISGAQINVFIPDYGYLGSAISNGDGRFSVAVDEFPDADNVILHAVKKDGEILAISRDATGESGGKADESFDGKDFGYEVKDIDKYASYSELASILPGIEVEDDVAMLDRVPVKFYVNGYLWPLSYDEHAVTERMEEKEKVPTYTPPLDGINPYKRGMNPSNPTLFADFRGDNMRTLKTTETRNFIQYRLSVLEEFCPIGLIGKAVYVHPDELREKFGVESKSGIVMLWTDSGKTADDSALIVSK